MTIINYFVSVRDENDKEDDDTIFGHGCMCNRCDFMYYSDHCVSTF